MARVSASTETIRAWRIDSRPTTYQKRENEWRPTTEDNKQSLELYMQQRRRRLARRAPAFP